MGIKLIVEVMDHAPRELTAAEWKALVILAEDANDATRKVWHGIESEHLLARLGISVGRWTNLRASMVRKGVLEQTQKAHRGSRAEFRIARLAAPAQSPDTAERVTEPVTQSDPEAALGAPESLTGSVGQSPAMGHGTGEAFEGLGHASEAESPTDPVRLSALMGHGSREKWVTGSVTPTPQLPPLLKPPPPASRWRAAPLMTTVPRAAAEEEDDEEDRSERSPGSLAGTDQLQAARQLVAALPVGMRPGSKHLPELADALAPYFAGGWTAATLARRLARNEQAVIRMPANYLLHCLLSIDHTPDEQPRAYCPNHPATVAGECGVCRAEQAISGEERPPDVVSGIDEFRRARQAMPRRAALGRGCGMAAG